MNMKLFLLVGVAVGVSLMTSCNGSDDSGNGESTRGGDNLFVPPSLPDSVYDILRPGDIIIRKGNGPLSAHIMINTKEEYSHCGIIVKEGDEWKVVHTIGGTASDDATDGVQLMSLSEFVGHGADSMVFLCRPVFADSLDIKIPERAYHYLSLKVPFDHRFSLFTPEKLYCSELLFYVFKEVNSGKNIFEVKKKHNSYMLMFSTFFDREKFEPIFHLRDDNRKRNEAIKTTDTSTQDTL